MKTVAISQRVDWLSDRGERRDCLDQRVAQFVEVAGYVPLPLPNSLSDRGLSEWFETVRPAALLLSGGGDLGSDPDRDSTEWGALRIAEDLGLAVLGVCRGMQQLGAFSGTPLVEVAGHVGARHSIHGDIAREVNSFHRYVLKDCPPEYRVVALDEDGHLEGIVHARRPWLGWMWHPERELPFSGYDLAAFRALVEHSEWEAR